MKARRVPGLRWLRCLPVLALAGCSGVQTMLDPASTDARLTALLAWWMFAVATTVFVVTVGLLLVAVTLQRRGGRKPISFRASTGMVVIGGVAAPILAIAAVTVSGVMISDETEGKTAVTGPTIEVAGKLWWWEFSYLDENGEITAVTANELHLPVGKRTRLRLTSDNVIHSFWVPNLQGKTDLIPGKVNYLYAEADVAGEWQGQCAEFCGLQHALMGFKAVAQPPDAFDAWLTAQAADAAVTSGPGFDAFVRLGCAGCHTIRGTYAAGQAGPDLTHIASRSTLAAATVPNSRGYLGGWITNTHQIKPGALMPATTPEPDELHALLDFLESLE